MNVKLLASLFRHLLTASGGAGLLSDNDLEQIAGAVVIVVGLVWSYLEKRADKKQAE